MSDNSRDKARTNPSEDKSSTMSMIHGVELTSGTISGALQVSMSITPVVRASAIAGATKTLDISYFERAVCAVADDAVSSAPGLFSWEEEDTAEICCRTKNMPSHFKISHRSTQEWDITLVMHLGLGCSGNNTLVTVQLPNSTAGEYSKPAESSMSIFCYPRVFPSLLPLMSRLFPLVLIVSNAGNETWKTGATMVAGGLCDQQQD